MTGAQSSERVTLAPCPFCCLPLTRGSRTINPWAKCTTEDCFGAKMPVVNLDHPPSVEAWNRRAALSTPATTVSVPWDGYPPNRDQYGWHWLAAGMDAEPYPLRWSGKGWWMGLADGSVSTVRETWTYIGPVVPAALSTPATTGEGEVERLKADLKDEINFDINTRTNKVPESVVDQVVDLLAERGVLSIAALPPSSGWQPIETAPLNVPIITGLAGEYGSNICIGRAEAPEGNRWAEEQEPGMDVEWVEMESGYSTVTHSTFAKPTHWLPRTTLPPPPSSEV